MTIQAIILLLISAFIHASWNYLSKRSRPTISFFLIAVFLSLVFFSPIFWLIRQWLSVIPVSVWRLLILTAIFQALYYATLAGAYRRGELSVVYPLVRALPVLMVAGVSWFLGRGAKITEFGLMGMILVAVGCLVLPMRKFQLPDVTLKSNSFLLNPAILLAILAAIGTTGYTIIDDRALFILRQAANSGSSGFHDTAMISMLYSFLEGVSIIIWLIVLVALIPAERKEIADWIRRIKVDFSIIIPPALAGIFMLLAYGLVLIAMAFVRDVSYISAFRQTSIPIGALIGILVEHEPAHTPKVVGLIFISAGLTLVALG